jgi:hypothetical protein
MSFGLTLAAIPRFVSMRKSLSSNVVLHCVASLFLSASLLFMNWCDSSSAFNSLFEKHVFLTFIFLFPLMWNRPPPFSCSYVSIPSFF